MNNPNFNQRMYEVSLEALTKAGVPVSAAEKASLVVASNDINHANGGRTPEQQKDVDDAMTWYWTKRNHSLEDE